MEVVAKSKFIRMTPRKLRLVVDQIHGLGVLRAVEILKNLDRRAAQPILLTLKQAIGNAINNYSLDKETLKIKTLEVGRGPIYKRWRFVARGRIHQVQKKTSHIKIVLEGEEAKVKPKEKQKIKDKKLKTPARLAADATASKRARQT